MSANTRQRMIESASVLVARRGSRGASFSEVLEASGAPRGSLYHHFPGGKEELVLAAVGLAGDRASALLAALDGQAADMVAAQFFTMWRALLTATDFSVGCAAAAVTVDAESDALIARAGAVFSQWRDRLTLLLERGGVPTSRSAGLAATLVAAAEGAVVLARAERDIALFDLVSAELTALVRGATTREAPAGSA